MISAFVDIQGVRRLETDDCSPLPGFSLMAIDMASRCHYFSLPSDDARDELIHAVNTAMFSLSSRTGKHRGNLTFHFRLFSLNLVRS